MISTSTGNNGYGDINSGGYGKIKSKPIEKRRTKEKAVALEIMCDDEHGEVDKRV